MTTPAALPTSSAFRDLLLREDPKQLTERYLLGSESFAFAANPAAFDRLADIVSKALGVTRGQIVLVGSGKLGFSTTPGKFPAPFGDRSDLDVAVISERHFDFYWTAMREWAYPRRMTRLPATDKNWLNARKEDLLWGWLHPTKVKYTGLAFPDALKPMRNESTKWFRTFQGLSREPSLAKWPIRPRLYRGVEQLTAYHTDGLRRLKDFETGRGAA